MADEPVRNYKVEGDFGGYTKYDRLISIGFPLSLRVAGWFYLIVSVAGGIYLISNTKISGSYFDNIPESTNYVYQAFGVTGIITGIIVFLILIALARIFEQNVLILQRTKKKK